MTLQKCSRCHNPRELGGFKTCASCRASNRAYGAAHREYFQVYAETYRKENREAIQDKVATYRAEHHAEISAYSAEWYAKNKDKPRIRRQRREWARKDRLAHPEHKRIQMRISRARKRGLPTPT